MKKKEIAYLLKRYYYINSAIDKGESSVIIKISGRKEFIEINERILTFVNVFKKVYESEKNFLIKKLIKINIIQGNNNLSSFSKQPLDRSTYFRYKKAIVDKIYHCCIYEGLVNLDEILNESVC